MMRPAIRLVMLTSGASTIPTVRMMLVSGGRPQVEIAEPVKSITEPERESASVMRRRMTALTVLYPADAQRAMIALRSRDQPLQIEITQLPG